VAASEAAMRATEVLILESHANTGFSSAASRHGKGDQK
jgi:hypothetical protein